MKMAIMVFMQLCFCYVILVDILCQPNYLVASAEQESTYKLSTTARTQCGLYFEECSLRNAPCVTGQEGEAEKNTVLLMESLKGKLLPRLKNPPENTEPTQFLNVEC